MRAYDPRIYPWARCRRDRQKMAGKPIYTIDAIAERRAVRALIRKLAGLAGEASRCPLYPSRRTKRGHVGMSALCQFQTLGRFRKCSIIGPVGGDPKLDSPSSADHGKRQSTQWRASRVRF